MTRMIKNFALSGLSLALLLVAFSVTQGVVYAAGTGVVSLTFDDSNSSQYTTIVPLLKAAGQTGVFFTNSGYLGQRDYMTWKQVQALQNAGFEVAGHTLTHQELPTLTAAAATREINNDSANFLLHGILATDFASPYGAYDNNTTALVAKKYNSHRAFANQGLNFWPYNKYLIYVHYVTNQTTLAQAKAWVDESIAQNGWLVLVFHEVMPTVDPTDDYSWETTKFKDFLSYLNTKQIKTKNINQVLAQSQNLVTNGSFEDKLTGWTIDAANNFVLNTATNGNYPTPKNSLRIVGSTTGGHMFGSKIPVTTGTQYGFRVYTDSRGYTGGEEGFYIDEYDQNGAWVSGKWLGGIYNQNVIDKSYAYTPTSAAVKTAALQVYMTPGSTGSVYIDNLELFAR